MSLEIPKALQAYHPGVGHVCASCGRVVVDAVETPGEALRCLECQGVDAAPEDELTRAALADRSLDALPDPKPTAWRLVVIVAIGVITLGIIFWWR